MNLLKIILILTLYIVHINATTITLTSPTEPLTFKDGDEYFTDVLNNAIDFDKRRDIMWEEKFDESTISLSNNTWQGSYTPGGYVMPLCPGMDGAIQYKLIGNKYPIDTTKYKAISILAKIKERYNEDRHSWFKLFWTHDASYHNATWEDIAGIDGYQLKRTAEVLMHEDDTFIYYMHNLSTNEEWSSSSVRGIKHSPSNQPNPNVAYRSIRIFDPETSEKLTVSWETSDLPEDAPETPQVEIYIDSDNSGYDGKLLFRHDGGNDFFRKRPVDMGSCEIKTAALAPGKYYLYLKLYSNYDVNDTDTDTLLATSGYSASITINAKSVITFQSPSMTSGEDYATTVLNNPWDMNDSEDITYNANLDSISFESNIYTATTSTNDPYFWLNTDLDNNKTIDTSKYRYATFTMKVEPDGYGNIKDKVARGWMSRIVWWNKGIIEDGSVTNDIVLFEGVNTYSIDLTSDVLELKDKTDLSQTGWLANRYNTYFRFDPLETEQNTQIHIYDFKLTATPMPDKNNKFTIEFTLADKENENMIVEFYRDDDLNGFDGIKIGSETYTSGVHSYTFDTSKLPNGEFYIYAIVKDSAGNISKHYAEVPISIKNNINISSLVYLLL